MPANFFQNLDERERLAYENRVKADSNAGNELNKTGDTATGLINFTGGITGTGMVSLPSVNLSGPLTAQGGIVAASGASLGTSTVFSNATTANTLIVTSTVLSPATVAPLIIVASTASEAVLAIQGVFISTASINLAASNTAFYIPVFHSTQGVLGFIAVSKGPA